jgi:3-oxoacyl-[acyl-carrier-protein] synthase II
MSEGAAMLILEREERARDRGAKMYARLAGYGQTCDATHIVMPDMNGQVAAMQGAIADAGLKPESIDYINAHATSRLSEILLKLELLKVFWVTGLAILPSARPNP